MRTDGGKTERRATKQACKVLPVLCDFFKLCKSINYVYMEINKYITPEVEVLDVYAEGVLCGSTDLDMDPEEGYM